MVGWAGISILFQEHNSATIPNIVLVFGRSIEQVSVECHRQ